MNPQQHKPNDAALRYSQYAFAVLMLVCLATLAIRAALRLEGRWDTPLYHLPFAAVYGGLDIPYIMSERITLAFQGFPPLAHFVQGWLWRLSGSVNATGVVNFLALTVLLAICQRKFRAPFYLFAAVALTAPLVLIHSTVSYVDLFGNSWLALGVICLFNAYYFEKTSDRSILFIGLVGLTAAAWTKFQLVPAVAACLLLHLAVYRPIPFNADIRRKKILLWVSLAGLIAALPYLKNWLLYGNPFWPVPIPILTDHFPYSQEFLQPLPWANSPPPLEGRHQSVKFFHSLFEIGHPHEYEHRHRWIIDQGNAWVAFRSGGFWNVGVVSYLLLAAGLALWLKPRKGLVVSMAAVAMLLMVSTFPQSHELRYYLFVPLVWAGIIASLYPLVRDKSRSLAFFVLFTVMGLFLYSSNINRDYYKVERLGYSELAQSWGADRYWPRMQAGVQYCAVGMVPMGFLLTGPTMKEFQVVDRSQRKHCPANSVVISGAPAGGSGDGE